MSDLEPKPGEFVLPSQTESAAELGGARPIMDNGEAASRAPVVLGPWISGAFIGPLEVAKERALLATATSSEQASLGARPRIQSLVASADPHTLDELYRYWSQAAAALPVPEPSQVEQRLKRWMQDPKTLDARLAGLGKRLRSVLEAHLAARDYHLAVADLVARKELAHVSSYELDAALAMLVRHGWLVSWPDRRFKTFGARAHAVVAEIGDALLRQERSKRRGVFDVLTLRGWLDRHYDDPARKQRIAPTRLREMYKMYSDESACMQRLERLPMEVKRILERTMLEFGGILPRAFYERSGMAEEPWQGSRWRVLLEESLLGTVDALDLSHYGIQTAGECLIVFNEVTLAWLRRVAVPSDPDQPHSQASLGVDLASNLTRFVGYIVEHSVRFTQRGEIFKTTEKKIQQELIPNPGRELSREEVLTFIYSCCKELGLIESTGERTFALTAQGRAWEQNDLEKKLALLLERAVEEKGLGGDAFHQLRMRRIYLRLLKRLDPKVWYDLMYLPFLARNTYLASLEPSSAEEYYGARALWTHAQPIDDTQRLAWNLARWVRQRLHILGLVDLGYDSAGRPVAVRLTSVGARVMLKDRVHWLPEGAGGNLIVTPDFEVVLFRTGDDASLTHELDRFTDRSATGETLHFRISEKSIQRALSEGVFLSRILDTLVHHSRVPVPQNVVFSVRDWGLRAGVMQLDSKLVLKASGPENMARLLRDPAARGLVRATIDELHVQLKARSTPKRMQVLLRDLGFLVELE